MTLLLQLRVCIRRIDCPWPLRGEELVRSSSPKSSGMSRDGLGIDLLIRGRYSAHDEGVVLLEEPLDGPDNVVTLFPQRLVGHDDFPSLVSVAGNSLKEDGEVPFFVVRCIVGSLPRCVPERRLCLNGGLELSDKRTDAGCFSAPVWV